MKIVTWNVNGLRARQRDGTLKKVLLLDPDILCLQEIKMTDDKEIAGRLFEKYYKYYKFSKKPGYGGVCILSKVKAKFVLKDLGLEQADNDGRFICAILDNKYSIMSVYVPHGKRDGSALQYKKNFIENLIMKLNSYTNNIICTDFNIAHQDIDLARPKNNKNNIMYSQSERQCIDELLACGYQDAFRLHNKENGNYTWWSYSHNAYQRNIGWRIDYFFISNNLVSQVKDVRIHKEIRGSDHSPMVLELGEKNDSRCS